ncbi:glutamate synthase small subunit [Peribacillus cavernae]|uniref:Glutamate synthase small subunit n=1 Tax=Peribacillus cavernae TaxID=1674310 RepID=A0A3S0U5D4_9BACI|nr:glutamate synthase small subunit [Peribacillus cavernae]MDQ0216984.1 glutamate synthase (NADPH/NADH) small chain [Peribacillus cavernae]RUQ30530.1 glutamate synthase small subunit [Peribacillus cavernae]
MGKITGFIEFLRETRHERDPKNRINDWEDYTLPISEEKVKEQGARCMDCGIPTCHMGTNLNGLTSGCPVYHLIPEWNDLVYQGQWKEALERELKMNNFPEFTGIACPAPCEGSCVLGINEPPVAIRTVERAIIEKGFAEGWVTPEPPKTRTGKKVAVVGSGPAGLACADQLNKVGHNVTVFERDDRPGGLLTYGIPEMKLPYRIVERRINLLIEEQITFVTNMEIGKDYPVNKLREDFDAVVLCCGALKPRSLPVETGGDFKGVHFAMEFLHANTKSLLDSNHKDGNYISASGKDVIVIGGGDTGTDCIATSIRHQCRSLVQFDIYGKRPETRAEDNPWPQWPVIHRIEYGQKEAAAFFGKDPRAYAIMTTKFVGDENGHVKEVHTINVETQFDQNGHKIRKQIPGTEKVWPAQLVLIAIGFTGPEQILLQQFGVETDEYSNAKAEYGKFGTNIEGVFAAGDIRRGQSLIVWAINEGRGAARECDRYLMGTTELP